MKNFKWQNLILPIATILCLIAIWSAVSLITNSEYILPSFFKTLSVAFSLLGQGKFYLAFLMTLVRTIIAFVLSFSLAFALAFLSIKSKTAEKIISPLISIIRALPTIAVVLLLLFWTNSFIAPIIVTMLVVLPTSFNSVKDALSGVDEQILQALRLFNVDKKKIFYKVQLPQITPPMLSAIGAGISLNLKLMVAAEVLSATVRSIGSLLNSASYNGEISTMIALVLITVVVGVAIESTFNMLAKRAGKWK